MVIDSQDLLEKPPESGKLAPARDSQFERSVGAGPQRNAPDPVCRHLMGADKAREIYGVQFGLHGKQQHEVSVKDARARILPMIGAMADMVDTFSSDYFNEQLAAAHMTT